MRGKGELLLGAFIAASLVTPALAQAPGLPALAWLDLSRTPADPGGRFPLLLREIGQPPAGRLLEITSPAVGTFYAQGEPDLGSDIYKVRVADGRTFRLTHVPRGLRNLDPAWSPDSATIAYSACNPSGSRCASRSWRLRRRAARATGSPIGAPSSPRRGTRPSRR